MSVIHIIIPIDKALSHFLVRFLTLHQSINTSTAKTLKYNNKRNSYVIYSDPLCAKKQSAVVSLSFPCANFIKTFTIQDLTLIASMIACQPKLTKRRSSVGNADHHVKNFKGLQKEQFYYDRPDGHIKFSRRCVIIIHQHP